MMDPERCVYRSVAGSCQFITEARIFEGPTVELEERVRAFRAALGCSTVSTQGMNFEAASEEPAGATAVPAAR
jgi:hypothetical protein